MYWSEAVDFKWFMVVSLVVINMATVLSILTEMVNNFFNLVLSLFYFVCLFMYITGEGGGLQHMGAEWGVDSRLF